MHWLQIRISSNLLKGKSVLCSHPSPGFQLSGGPVPEQANGSSILGLSSPCSAPITGTGTGPWQVGKLVTLITFLWMLSYPECKDGAESMLHTAALVRSECHGTVQPPGTPHMSHQGVCKGPAGAKEELGKEAVYVSSSIFGKGNCSSSEHFCSNLPFRLG